VTSTSFSIGCVLLGVLAGTFLLHRAYHREVDIDRQAIDCVQACGDRGVRRYNRASCECGLVLELPRETTPRPPSHDAGQ
jgi:hypothetical protein